jgi:hypothetical protein
MNYEELLSQAKMIDKELTERMKAQQKLEKGLQNSMEAGDLKSWLRDTELLLTASEDSTALVARMRELASGFDAKAYVESGNFADEFVGYCESADLDVKGEFPVYEVFPYRVRMDTETLDFYVDRKKVQCLSPRVFARSLKASRDKLMKVSFNALAFAGELADAYDTALLRQKKEPEADCYLSVLYQYLAPMSRSRRDYDKQSYAFDLARLYSSGLEETKDGRRFQFGPTRNNAKAIRILDAEGAERFLATVRFFR